jgi:hypothetical protein
MIMPSDPVKPSHYHDHDGSGIHCHNAQKAMLGPDGYKAYLAGMVMKYTWRYKYKNGLQDLNKAVECLRMLIEENSSGADNETQLSSNDSTISEQHMAQGEEGDIFSTSVQNLDRPASSASRISVWGIDCADLSLSFGDQSQRWNWFEEGSGSGQSGESNMRPFG